MEFDEEAMKEIKEIDAFLRKVSLSRMEPLEQQLLGYTNYFCVAVRVKAKICGEELEAFVHQYILERDFDYKIDYYIAKGIYLANKNKHYEVYYTVNLLRARFENGICVPRRSVRNMTMASCIFCDLDLEEPYASLSDKDLLERLKAEQGELLDLLQPILVRSGQGLHMYVLLEESIDLSNEAKIQRWKQLCTRLAFLLRDYNADYKVVDTARILRCVHSINRKQKYGGGKKVALLLDSNERHFLDEIDDNLEFLMQGGITKVYEDILGDVMDDDSYDPNFIHLDFNDDIFTDEEGVYRSPAYIESEYRRLFPCENETSEKKESESTHIEHTVTSKFISTNTKKGKYKGISCKYEDFPDMMWQNKDLLFWICNRESVEGYRNLLIYFFCFNMYYFERYRSLNAIYERMNLINQKYIRPKISDKELRFHTKRCFQKFEKNIRTRYIANATIQKYFPFTDEEKKCTIGNYYKEGSKEHYEKYLEQHREYNRKYYYEKVRENERIDYFLFLEKERKEKCMQYIKEHPFDTYNKAIETIQIGENQYYTMRMEIQKELGLYKEKGCFYEPFRVNPDISYDEYNLIFPCSIKNYYSRKNRYKHSLKKDKK